MKDGTTHLAYKAEQAVDLKTETILSARLCHATPGNTQNFLGLILALRK